MTIKEKLSDRISRRELIKPVTAGVFGFAFFNLFKVPFSAQTTNNQEQSKILDELPPIIIKSGSFIIESDLPLAETSGNPYKYRRSGFMIRRVLVIKVNEYTGAAETIPFADANGIELDIQLQHYVNDNWQPLAQSPLAQILNETVPGSTNFLLKIPKDLDDDRGKPKPPRKGRREDKGNDTFRFGSVIIRGKGTKPAPDVPPTVDGDEYIINLYANQ